MLSPSIGAPASQLSIGNHPIAMLSLSLLGDFSIWKGVSFDFPSSACLCSIYCIFQLFPAVVVDGNSRKRKKQRSSLGSHSWGFDFMHPITAETSPLRLQESTMVPPSAEGNGEVGATIALWLCWCALVCTTLLYEIITGAGGGESRLMVFWVWYRPQI